MNKIACLFIFCLACVGNILAQSSIKGTVHDAESNPVPYLSVLLNGSVLGTNTDEDGKFELSNIKPGNYTLRISGIGYATLEKEVNLSDQANVELDLTVNTAIGMLDEIVVSASRSAEALDETPSSVTIVDSKTIANQMKVSPNIANILAASVPGLAMNSNTTSNTGQTLRGRNVLVMIDGIPQSTPLRAGGRDIRTIDPEAIERIEVIKGATAIYGNGADGGLINYITKKPNAGEAFSAETYLANTGMLVHSDNTLGGRVTQQFSGKISAFDYVVSGTYERTGVFKDAEGLALSPVYGLGESDIYNVFVKSGYDINSNHRVELMYNFFSSQQESDYVEQIGKFLESPTIGVKGDRQGDAEGTRYNHNAQLRYFGNKVIGQTGVEASVYTQQFQTLYGFSSFFENGGQSTIKSDKKGARLSLNTPVFFGDNINGEIVYGVDYLNDITSQPLMDGRTWVPEIDLRNTAPYAQLRLNLFDDLIFKAGYRYDNVFVQVPDFTQLRDANGNGGNFVNGGDIKFDASTLNIGLRYIGIEAFKPYVSFSQGFSIIDIGRYVRAATEDDVAKMDIEPVIVNSYEAGFHSKFGKVSFSGAAFLSTSELGANLVANADNSAFFIQRAPERVYGFEAVVDVFIARQIQWGASAAYTEGKVDLNDNGEFDEDNDAYLNGTRIPPVKITSYVNVKPLEKMDINLQWIYSGERKRFDPRPNGTYGFGEGPVSSFDIFNLSASYQFSNKFGANLGIENLLNKTYYLPISYWYGRDSDFTRSNGMRYQLGLSFKW